jgi:hypothetical protein
MSSNIAINSAIEATNDLALFSVCSQRKQSKLLSVPPIRLELQPSPYPAYNQQQLNMRRKIEILKYSGVHQNTKTNSQSKYQKWSQIVRGKNNVSASLLKNGTLDCSGDEYIPTPTSSCDVPGPVMILQYDDTVPLYNYATNINDYAIINETITDLWKTFPVDNTEFLTNASIKAIDVSATLTPLYIQPIVDQRTYDFVLKTSVGIYITGITGETNVPNTLSIVGMDVIICYNTVPVKVIPVQTLGSFNSLTFTASTTGQTFSALLYVGDLITPTFSLATEPEYVYDIKIKFTFKQSLGQGTSLTALGAYANLTSDKINVSTNCTITSIPYATNTIPFTLTGS